MNDTETKKRLAANLERLLDQRGWNQARLARESGETEMTVSRILRKEQMPGLGIVTRLALALGVSVDELLSSGKSGRNLQNVG